MRRDYLLAPITLPLIAVAAVLFAAFSLVLFLANMIGSSRKHAAVQGSAIVLAVAESLKATSYK